MTDENGILPAITSSTKFGSGGDCNTNGLNSTTEQFIICCNVCGSFNSLRRCSRCKSVYYCSQVHQQVDWRVHKIECKKFASNLASSEFILRNAFEMLWIYFYFAKCNREEVQSFIEKYLLFYIFDLK